MHIPKGVHPDFGDDQLFHVRRIKVRLGSAAHQTKRKAREGWIMASKGDKERIGKVRK